MNTPVDVLVVGAGPVGMTLALQAHAHGARVRVVERRPRRFRPSRAMIVHPRTLEVLRPLGVVDAVLARADTAPRGCLHVGGRVVPAPLDHLDLPDTAYPHLTLVRQADVEAVLAEALAARDVPVDHDTELIDCVAGRPGVRAALRTAGGPRQVDCRAVAGCDGADSTVRLLAGLPRRESGYRQQIVLADVALAGGVEPGLLHVHAGRHGLCFLFPHGERAPWRLLITSPATGPAGGSAHPGTAPDAGEVQALLDEAGVAARVASVAWSTRLHLRHGVARAYRNGPLFVAGDAAHVHSPAGGLGMNVGIQDAVNLGWKLALAAHSTRPAWLLDSYTAERRRAARRARCLTNLLFQAESGTDPVTALARGTTATVAAPLVPALLRRRHLVAGAVRMLGQLSLTYRGSPLSAGAPHRPGAPRPGERVPDVPVVADGRPVRLHALTARPGVHVLLDRDAAPVAAARGPVHVRRLDSAPGRGLLAVRPDGYAGASAARAGDPAVAAWLAAIGAPLAPAGR